MTWGLLLEKFLAGPILVANWRKKVSHKRSCSTKQPDSQNILSIRHIPAHDKRNLLLAQLLDGNLQGICLALEIDQDGSVHADLQRAGAEDARLLVFGHEGRRGALVVGNLLVLVRLLVALACVGCRVGVA